MVTKEVIVTMNTLENSNIKVYLRQFRDYCFEDKGLDGRTVNRYESIIDNYLNTTVLNSIDLSTNELFTTEKVIKFQHKLSSPMVRYALLAFNNFLFEREFINESQHKIDFNKAINDSFPKSKNDYIEDEKKQLYLSPSEIRTLFSGEIIFNNDEDRYTFPLVISLSYFCLFNQKEIESLKLNDINLEDRTIKNIRFQRTENAAPYIQMNNILFNNMQQYLKYREKLDIKKEASESLIIIKGETIENKGFTQLFNVINSAAKNRDLIKNSSLSSGLLLRSSMLYTLRHSSENGVIELSKLIGFSLLSNKYFKPAFKDFQKKHIELNESDTTILKDLEQNLPNFTKEPSNTDYFNFGNSYTPYEFLYSEENDITLNDIEDHDMKKDSIPITSKVVIQRLVRDSKIARELKIFYKNYCQVCNTSLRKSDGSYYSEAHHIQPYNKIHQGDDIPSNLLVLCSNCHTQFDDSFYAIEPTTKEVHCIFSDDAKHLTKLNLKHELNLKYLDYAWNLFKQKQK